MVPFRLARGMAVTVFLVSAARVTAADIVCPNANTTVAGDAGLNTVFRNLSRTHQILIAASELANLPNGTPITGLTFRAQPAQASAFPPTGITATFTDYTIEVATAATTPATMSTTLAANVGPDAVVVRSGPHSIAPLAFSNANNPTAFGPTIPFTTYYVYTGGNLVITIRHSGNAQNVNSFMDCITPAGPGYGTLVRAMSGNSSDATVGTQAAATIVRLTHCDPVPCRGDVNGDLVRNGLDVQGFANAFISCAAGGVPFCGTCYSSDVDGDGAINAADVTALADFLLAGVPCQ